MTTSLTRQTVIALSLPLIIILLGFPHISETIYTPALPQLALDLATSSQMAELTLSIYFVGFAAGVAIWGYCCDAFSRRMAMLTGIAIYAASCVALWKTTNIETLLALRFIQALGASAGSVVTQTMIRDIYEGKARNQIFAIVGGAISFSPAIGPWLGGYLCMTFGWQINFFVLAVFGIALLCYCYLYLPETRAVGAERKFHWSHLLKLSKKMVLDKNIALYVLLISACNGIVFGFYAEAPFLFIDLMGFTPVEYGLFGLILCAAGVLSSFISHRLNESLSSKQIIFCGAIVTLLGSLYLCAAAFFGIFNLNVSSIEITVIVVGIAITFCGISMVIPNSLSNALTHYKDTLGMAGAIYGCMYYIGISAFVALMSYVHNGTPYPMPLLFTLFSGCLVASSLLIKEK